MPGEQSFQRASQANSQTLAPQRFVGISGDPRGIGLFIDADGDVAEVEFFHAASRAERSFISLARLERAYLAPQTRVYFRTTDERWRMGRVRDFMLQDDGSVVYEVKLPNRKDIDIPEALLRVRCYASEGDPADVLAMGASETQRWFDARWIARKSLIDLRVSTQGLTGLTSASVELVGHQMDAVRRVLHDPLQRYLLADEVGLGKTIEAGAIVRQTLLDARESTALILAPASLTAQWIDELRLRFGLECGPSARTRVMPLEALEDPLSASTILVVDEAHRVEPGSADYENLRALARSCPKLLLLSATPVIGNEAALLSLLRLLDPARWDDEQEETFQRHVALSQEYGRLLLGLRPDASAFVLKQRVAAATAAFPEDPIVAGFAARFSASEDPADRTQACASLRQHIAETYRIHHRIIRSRRADLEGWEFQPRGPASVRIEEDDSTDLARAYAALEDWRSEAVVRSKESQPVATSLQRRFLTLLNAISVGQELEEATSIFEGEADLLTAINAELGPAARQRRAKFAADVSLRHLRFLAPAKGNAAKLVVFTSDPALAVEVSTALNAVGANAFAGAAACRPFEEADQSAVLVLGPEGEEGLNLHFADAIVHADLPASVARLEQRIGRLDRFGRHKGPIKHIAICPASEEDSPWSSWLDLLRDGFTIFDRPISDIQFALDKIETEVTRRRILGAADLSAFTGELTEQIAEQRKRLDEQYALDQLAMSRDSARDLVETTEEAEADEIALENQLTPLLSQTLQLSIRRQGPGICTLGWTPSTLMPERPWRAEFAPTLKRPITWKRRISVNHPGVALVRPGSHLTDALERLLAWDDRGTAFSTWRFRPGAGAPGEERLAFRLCWVIGPGRPPAKLLKGEDPEGLRRQAEVFLPPSTFVQHLAPDLTPVTDGAWLETLTSKYLPEAASDGSRDFNLGSRPEWLAEIIGRSEFVELCANVKRHSLLSLQDDAAHQAHLKDAAVKLAVELQRRTARRALRIQFEPQDALEREAQLDGFVSQLVAEPEARLDSIGVIVTAGWIPGAPRR